MRRCKIALDDPTREERIIHENGWFHGIYSISKVIEPSMLKGGHNGGQITQVLAIVETEVDRRLRPVNIRSVEFLDEPYESEGRRCEYFVRSSKPNLGIKNEGVWKKGVFHAWSKDFEEFDNGPGLYPVAIVEDKDGSIHSVYAENVRFPKGE